MPVFLDIHSLDNPAHGLVAQEIYQVFEGGH